MNPLPNVALGPDLWRIINETATTAASLSWNKRPNVQYSATWNTDNQSPSASLARYHIIFM